MPTRYHRLFSIITTFLLIIVAVPIPTISAANTTVSFAYWGDPAEAAAYEQVIASFENSDPNIQIEGQYTPGKSDYKRRISTAFAGDEAPDIFLINYRDYGQYADSGALQSLGPMLSSSDAISESDFYDIALDAFRFDGNELTCIPQNISSLVVYYNVDLFEKAGIPLPKDDWTLKDFEKAATALTTDEDGDGEPEIFGLATESSIIRFAPFIWSAGGDIVDDVDNPTRLTLDTPEAREAIEWFVNLGAGGLNVLPSEAAVLAEDDLSLFMNGRAGMFMQSRRVVPTLREIEEFRWDVAALPRDNEPASILHSDAICMAATTENPMAAWAFIEYALGPMGQQILAETGRTVPSLKSVAQSPVFLNDNALPSNSEVFLDIIPWLRRTPSTASWPEIERIFNSEFQGAHYSDFVIDRAITTAEARAQDVFRRADVSNPIETYAYDQPPGTRGLGIAISFRLEY